MDVNRKKEIHTQSNPFLIIEASTLKIVDANEAAVSVFGYSKEEFLKMHIFSMFPEFALNRAKENEDLFRNQKMFLDNTVYQAKNGVLLKVRIAAHRISFNNKDCWQTEIKLKENDGI